MGLQPILCIWNSKLDSLLCSQVNGILMHSLKSKGTSSDANFFDIFVNLLKVPILICWQNIFLCEQTFCNHYHIKSLFASKYFVFLWWIYFCISYAYIWKLWSPWIWMCMLILLSIIIKRCKCLVVVQQNYLSLPTRVEVELGCEN